MQILRLLVERRGEVLTREEVRALLWPGNASMDADDALSTAVRKIRVALCESAGKPHYVETLPKSGYRFIAQVSAVNPAPVPVPVPKVETEVPRIEPQPAPIRHSGLRWGRAVAFAIVALGIVVLRWPRDSPSAPVVLRSVQLTHDGLPKYGQLVSDGVRLYFDELDRIVQVSIAGGEAVSVARGWATLAISPDGAQLLVTPVGHDTQTERSLASLHLPAATLLPLGIQGHAGAWSPDGEKLVYANDVHLYLAGKDGAAPRRLTTAPGRTESPSWSPDGTRVRFAVVGADASRSLWEVPADGGRLQKVPGPSGIGSAPLGSTWTHDGRYYLFGWPEGKLSGLWAVRQSRNAWGREAQQAFQLTDGAISFSQPVLSRDGTKIFAMGIVVRGELMHYDSRKRAFAPYLPGLTADSLAYSADGDSMVWIQIPEGTMWQSRADGSERLQLTSAGIQDVQSPRWSPDGKSIVFAGRPEGKAEHLRLYTVPAGGGKITEVLRASFDQTNPNWSPDGRSLYFGDAPWLRGFALGSSVIRRVDLRTGAVTVLPGSEGLWAPKLSPDGRFLAAEGLDSQTLQLYDFRTETWTRLARIDRVIGYPCWTHDSQSLYFNTDTQPPAVYRVDRGDRVVRMVASLNGFNLTGSLNKWFGLTPDDSWLIMRDANIQEIYALDVRFP